jgi:copper(I)-binding protein
MPDLTTEESAIISEYAAGLMLKYSSNYDYKLVDNIEILTPDDTDEAETETDESTETETSADDETLTDASYTGENEHESEAETQAQEVSLDTDIASILGIDGVDIKYASYEISDSYPKDKDGYSVSASQGNTLLVLHFSIENTSSEDYTLNLISDNISAKITVNDSLTGNGLNTMLPNDLLSYYDTITAGSTEDAVILAQLSESAAQELNTIIVKISSSNGSVDLKIE